MQKDYPKVRCLDDVPSAARLATRQQFFKKWYHALALVPFAIALFIVMKFFPESTSALALAPVWLALAWAGIVIVYTAYITLLRLKCPVCGWRFGIGDKCRSCGLPRHRDPSVSI